MANIQKCEAVLAHITMNPESHDQTSWASMAECCTACCFAGWAAVLNGWRLSWENEGHQMGRYTSWVVRPGGDLELISEVAREVLELTPRESGVLFHGANTLTDLEQMVKNLANGDPIEANTGYIAHTAAIAVALEVA
jgi:hypothetical protein